MLRKAELCDDRNPQVESTQIRNPQIASPKMFFDRHPSGCFGRYRGRYHRPPGATRNQMTATDDARASSNVRLDRLEQQCSTADNSCAAINYYALDNLSNAHLTGRAQNPLSNFTQQEPCLQRAVA